MESWESDLILPSDITVETFSDSRAASSPVPMPPRMESGRGPLGSESMSECLGEMSLPGGSEDGRGGGGESPDRLARECRFGWSVVGWGEGVPL